MDSGRFAISLDDDQVHSSAQKEFRENEVILVGRATRCKARDFVIVSTARGKKKTKSLI